MSDILIGLYPLALTLVLIFALVAWIVKSLTITHEGNNALVERWGRYHRTLKAGPNWIIPFCDRVIVTKSVRERILDIEFQPAITKDMIDVRIDIYLYWAIKDLVKAYYVVEDVEESIKTLVITKFRDLIGERNLDEIACFYDKDTLKKIIKEINEVAVNWGVEVFRIEMQDVWPKVIMDAIEQERAAEREKKAAELEKQTEILKAEAQKQSMLIKIETTVEAIKLLSEAMDTYPNAREILQFLRQSRF